MSDQKLPENPNIGIVYDPNTLHEIWLAGGCFWGVQAYFDRIYGVAETSVGYANGKTENPTYSELKKTGHAETVKVHYDPGRVSLKTLLEYYFLIIDPTSVNRQGADAGTQYRTGIYYLDDSDLPIILSAIKEEQKKHKEKIVTEVKKLEHYFLAEEYHQEYLENNPDGYCHVDFSKLRNVRPSSTSHSYHKPSEEEMKKGLTPMQLNVTQKNETEPPFQNPFWNTFERGIYVDVVTGEPLFLSSDKFNSGCGWPSFSKPVKTDSIVEKSDNSHQMHRIEVRSEIGDSHLGHVFPDGPKEQGGLRYCINSASLRFIPIDRMEAEGYAEYISQVK